MMLAPNWIFRRIWLANRVGCETQCPCCKKERFKVNLKLLRILFNVLEVTERGCKVAKIIEKLKGIKNCINKVIDRSSVTRKLNKILPNLYKKLPKSLNIYIKV
jgi:hypothetical protein